jgi:hypothetical protein
MAVLTRHVLPRKLPKADLSQSDMSRAHRGCTSQPPQHLQIAQQEKANTITGPPPKPVNPQVQVSTRCSVLRECCVWVMKDALSREDGRSLAWRSARRRWKYRCTRLFKTLFMFSCMRCSSSYVVKIPVLIGSLHTLSDTV